jgi:glycosyltransferase involved in cell wall biosynthesis
MLKDITIIILTYNEEKNLPSLLKSIEGITPNIYIVDSYSIDKTMNYIKKSGFKYKQNQFENYSIQRNFAQQSNPFKTEWVLHLDADEPISSSLKSWLIKNFPKLKEDYDGFMFSRKTLFMGKWIRFGGQYPNFHLRLFKSKKGRCEDKAYDQHYIVNGVVKKIKNAEIINTVMNNLDDFIISHNRWATKEASEQILMVSQGEIEAKFFGNPIQRLRWLKLNIFGRSPLFFRAFLYFFYRYIIRLGFLDGKQGLIFFVLQSFWFRFLIDSKVFEKQLLLKREKKEKAIS